MDYPVQHACGILGALPSSERIKDVFELRDHVVTDYSDCVRSFITIRDARIRELVEREMNDGALWPDPLIQLNPSFEPSIDGVGCLRVMGRRDDDWAR